MKLYADAEEGYYFDGWYEDGKVVSSDNPLVIKVEQDRQLIAIFNELMMVSQPPIENITQNKKYSNMNTALNEAQDGDIIEVEVASE